MESALATLFAALLAQAGPVNADRPAERVQVSQSDGDTVTAAESNAGQVEDSGRMICRTESIAGSRLRTRETCRTADGWKRHKEDSRAHFKGARDRVSGVAK